MIDRLNRLMRMTPDAALLLFTRIAVGHIFWASGRTKVEGWALRPEAIDLFRDEYQLPILSPELAATLAAIGEHLFPIMLLIGLGTRYAALGLFGMTLVIQLFVYPEAWWVHALWFALLAWLIARGGGAWSVDALVARRQQPPERAG